MRIGILPVALLSISVLLTNCKESSDEASTGVETEVAIAAISGTSNSSEARLSDNADFRQKKSFLAHLQGVLSPIPNAWAVPSCSWSSLITGCSSNSSTITFDGCSDSSDHAISIKGSLTLAWTGVGCCTSNPLNASSIIPCTFTRRTLGADGSTDPVIHALGSHSVTLNTEDNSGYNEAKTGGFTVTCQGAEGNNTCDGQRQIVINGAHYVGQSGRGDWDHTVSTENPLIVQGHGENRRTLSGSISVQNNLLKYTSVTTITSTLTHSSNCCYPTGGTVSTTFSGGTLDGQTESMKFGPGCGTVTLNDTKQQKTGLTLHHCL
jgi:hypothetical protein